MRLCGTLSLSLSSASAALKKQKKRLSAAELRLDQKAKRNGHLCLHLHFNRPMSTSEQSRMPDCMVYGSACFFLATPFGK